jgi:hypothetical protein
MVFLDAAGTCLILVKRNPPTSSGCGKRLCVQREKQAEWRTALRLSVEQAGSAVASAHPTVSPERISRVKSSASGAMVTGVFTRRSGTPSQKRLKLAARHPVTHP